MASPRSQIVARRTYQRPLNDDGTRFESFEQMVARAVRHQQWLWERAKGGPLSADEGQELAELESLILEYKASLAGRTLWLGGTEISRVRESSNFNCSFTNVETVYDVVDVLWLLLQGCGVGFAPITGTLNGFTQPIPNIEVIRSERTEKGGGDYNEETVDGGVWTIRVGDSAEAWAKAIGKLLRGKYVVDTLVLDFSKIRPAGGRLSGYGWLCSGDGPYARALVAIAGTLNKRAGSLLTKLDIMDVVNHLGTVLSSRRSAEICLMDYGSDEWREFARAKKDFWLHGNEHRQQSNNSLVFHSKPSREQLADIFALMEECGGSEPGFINAAAAKQRAQWFQGVNPCGEVLLANKSFCCLVEVNTAAFKGDTSGLHRALWIMARANYRQTLVDFNDGVLSEAWHLNNEFLHLCGVGITGLAQRDDLKGYDLRAMERGATAAAYSMADELGTPRPKNVTTTKPSGTLSKVMDTTEGVHKPLGRYIFNNIGFSKHDPLLEQLRQANYRVFPHPTDEDARLVTLPARWDDVEFDLVDGVEVNLESAVAQLGRYKRINNTWNQQNTSTTVSYSPEEVPTIIDWLMQNWDSYVGVSFIYRDDPTKTAADLGYPYLPQEVVDKATFEAYEAQLKPVSLDGYDTLETLLDDECASGACPVR